MSEATLRCPGCGAPAAPDAASCAYCGSALATVTCASCFAPMFVGSRFCAHCGAEAARELVDDERTLACPRCREPLQGLRLGATAARECHACGGLWLDPDTLQRLADGREAHAGVISALAARAASASATPDTVTYIPCPDCAKLMNRVNFARASGVIVDVCRTHGVWLDRGELQHVLQFIDDGGLARARDHEREQLADERRRLAAMLANPSRDSGMTAFTLRHDGRPDERDAVPTGVFATLLSDLLGAIGG